MIIKEKFDWEHLFFISDNHFGHDNIIEYCDRPFVGVGVMNNSMIKRWNSVVTNEDDVIMLGDMFFKMRNSDIKEILDELFYKNIYLVEGNHDHRGTTNARYNRERFEIIADRLEIRVNDPEVSYEFQTIICDHYPLLRWNHMHRGSWHFYGHVHDTLDHPSLNAIDLSVDCDYMDFRPASYDKLKKIITKRNLNR